MLNYLADSKNLIITRFDSHLRELREDFSRINRWGPDTLSRLRDYIAGGKMIRGGLIRSTHDMFSGRAESEALSAGVAMELFQAAFLIHDDIMDRDETRRGKPSIHAQYARLAASEGIEDSAHLGEALGICTGDLAIFMAFEILGRLELSDSIKTRLLLRFCREFSYVGLAQMDDVYLGAGERGSSREAILSLYTYKTGRYTFSLPFAAGLILAGRDEATEKTFMELGEMMGVLFQIKDDELGIWSDEGELGKPVGSDLSENKKTLYRELLYARASEQERATLDGIYGSATVSSEDLACVRELLDRHSVKKEMDAFTAELSDRAEVLIRGLPSLSEGWRSRLLDLLVYIRERKK